MIKKILLVLALLIVVILIIAAMKPNEFTVSRSISIAAPPATVFAQVNDFHKWAAWSPFEQYDPAMKKTFSGTDAGKGAIYDWEGNSKAGKGRMTITESRPSELVHFQLEFLKPFEVTNQAEFTFKPEGDKTVVTWSMNGKNNFVFKIFQVFMSMDKMVGADFERGLASLKTLSEAAPKN